MQGADRIPSDAMRERHLVRSPMEEAMTSGPDGKQHVFHAVANLGDKLK